LPALQAQIEKDVAVAKELFEIRHD
jgi:hypothetical protein